MGQKDQKLTNTTLTIKEGAEFDGRINVGNASGTTVTAKVNFDAQKSGIGSAIFFNDDKGTLDLSGSNFTNNEAGTTTGATTGAGGAIYSYAKTLTQVGGSYVGNKAVSNGYAEEKYNGKAAVIDGALGGAMVIKGNTITLTDVLIAENSAVATKTEDTVGGAAYGGAILVDYSTGHGDGSGQNRTAELTVKITKDMAYTGNTVSSDSTGSYFNTY